MARPTTNVFKIVLCSRRKRQNCLHHSETALRRPCMTGDMLARYLAMCALLQIMFWRKTSKSSYILKMTLMRSLTGSRSRSVFSLFSSCEEWSHNHFEEWSHNPFPVIGSRCERLHLWMNFPPKMPMLARVADCCTYCVRDNFPAQHY